VNRTPISSIMLIGLIIASVPAGSAAGLGSPAPYPAVRALTLDDPLFVQQQAELADFHQIALAKSNPVFPPVSLFSYQKRPGEDLFSLNARLGLRYETLATLNGASSREDFDARARILLPGQDGLFVSNPPRGDLEDMVLASRLADGKKPLPLRLSRDGRPADVLYFPGEAFTSIERAYFLGILFRLPIAKGKVSSMFGMRADPFTGAREFHAGLDLAAPEGTEVRAARDGTVEEAGTSDVLGRYIVLAHPGGFQTIYGHLSSISVTIKQKVSAGALIGAVGQTGRATGAHLHFEVRKKGGAEDPFPLLAMKKH
jgi:murein DD-endopeptidase MepM/ murein hydrolase activator NlpD